jgi:NADP-dependent 3-hydroxy acid dehydrogenase YdfG
MTLYKSALVTGAGRGIGAETVRKFRAAGMEVHAVARSPEDLAALAAETGCVPHALDVTDDDTVQEAFGDLEIDVLVNNAGTSGPDGPIHELDPATLKRILEVNVEGVAAMLRSVIPGMRARNRGHIVNITSIAALHPLPGQIAYSASKMALRAMTQNLRIELFGKRIRVTEIAPARVETYFHAHQFSGDREETKRTLYDGFESLKPEDIADAIAYCVGAPERVDVTLMEILPTLQVIGGINFHKEEA